MDLIKRIDQRIAEALARHSALDHQSSEFQPHSDYEVPEHGGNHHRCTCGGIPSTSDGEETVCCCKDLKDRQEKYFIRLSALLANVRRTVLGINVGVGITEEVYERITNIVMAGIESIKCMDLCDATMNKLEDHFNFIIAKLDNLTITGCIDLCDRTLAVIESYTLNAILKVVTPGWSQYGLPEIYELIKRGCAGSGPNGRTICHVNYILLRRLLQ
jgi:hypothetical protein